MTQDLQKPCSPLKHQLEARQDDSHHPKWHQTSLWGNRTELQVSLCLTDSVLWLLCFPTPRLVVCCQTKWQVFADVFKMWISKLARLQEVKATLWSFTFLLRWRVTAPSNSTERGRQISWTSFQRLMLCSVKFMYRALVVVLLDWIALLRPETHRAGDVASKQSRQNFLFQLSGEKDTRLSVNSVLTSQRRIEMTSEVIFLDQLQFQFLI